MKFNASFTIEHSDYTPVWDGKKWQYMGRTYRSLRLMKSNAGFKLESKLAKILCDEITKEIDNSIVDMILAS